MAKINYRADNTYLIEGSAFDNPKLMGRAMSDGRDSLYLEFYYGKEEAISKKGVAYQKIIRKTEKLGLFLWRAPRTPQERAQNHETLSIAKRLRFERGQQLLNDTQGYRLKKSNAVDMFEWMQCYYERYTKADKRHIGRARTLLMEFCAASPDYQAFTRRLPPKQLTRDMVTRFADYLQQRFTGEGPHTVFARFKKIMKAATAEGLFDKSPCEGVSIRIDEGVIKKDILSVEEIQKLIATYVEGQSDTIRDAFIFCLYTGLRFCDVKNLRYSNIDFANKLLKFDQAKTSGHSSASWVMVPLSDGVIDMIGHGRRDDLIFALPSHTMCLKALRHWTARAGIDKHITWHCARHSFAVNVLTRGADIKTVSSLLGHASLKHTEKYTRAVDTLKRAAIDSLPDLIV